MLYKEVGADDSNHEVDLNQPPHRHSNPNSIKRGVASDGKPPAAPPRSDDDNYIDIFPDHRCPCADCIDEPDGGHWIFHPCGLRFEPLSLYLSVPISLSRCTVYSIIPNRISKWLDL